MCIAIVASVALLQAKSQTFEVAKSLRAVVLVDPQNDYYKNGSILELRERGQVIAKMRARDLIDTWLKSDSFWGGHSQANQMRYLDHPDANVHGGIQGHVYEVVPASGGCLVRIGIISTTPSRQPILKDVILRWSASSPNTWPVFDMSDSGWPAGPTIKLPNWRGHQFLISGTTVYRLEGKAPRKALSDTLPSCPARTGWTGVRESGSRLLLGSGLQQPKYEVLELRSGKAGAVTAADAKTFGLPPNP